MFNNWNEDDRSRYLTLLDEQMRTGCLVMCVLAMFLFPVFGILDYLNHHDHLRELWIVRGIVIFIYFLFFMVIWFRYDTFLPKLISYSMAMIASITITVQCNVLGGFVAPYYTGIMLVMITTVAVNPFPTKEIALCMGIEILIYVIGCSSWSPLSVLQSEAFINNMFMLISTGFIGIFASWSLEKQRLLSFDRYLQLENAKKDLMSSREMLQSELASEQNNVEMLVKEITQRKAELERALDLRKEFISLASHELNTPLTSLKLITQMVLQKMQKNQEPDILSIKKLLKTYDEQIIRLTRIVTDMLDVSRIDNGKLTLEKHELDLEKLIQEIVEFSSTGYQAQIHFSSCGTVLGLWDRIRLEQVMLNLVNNAIKYGNGRPVKISLSTEGGEAKIVVRDEGIGIPSEYLNRIFERFERAVTSYQFSGMGVGLYIAKQIIVSHNGQIQVESMPGKGSEFRVTLPIVS